MWLNRYTVREEVPNPEDAPPGAATPTPEEELPTIADEEPNLWEALSADIEEDDSDDSMIGDEPEPPVEEPLEPPVVPEEPEVVPPVVPEPEPEAEPPAVPETPPEPEPPVEQPTPEDIAPEPVPPTEEQVAEQRRELEGRLETRFAITDEEALQMVTEPGKVFPKLQARMFADMWTHFTQMMREHLPEAIEHNVRTMESRDEKVNSFFTAWPKLSKATHGKAVSQVAKLYSGINPNATEADIIKYVGMQVMMMHNLTPDSAAPPADDTPATPPVVPFQPASVNGGQVPSQQSDNIWSGMAEELLEDDQSG
jgi:hypothetical protein